MLSVLDLLYGHVVVCAFDSWKGQCKLSRCKFGCKFTSYIHAHACAQFNIGGKSHSSGQKCNLRGVTGGEKCANPSTIITLSAKNWIINSDSSNKGQVRQKFIQGCAPGANSLGQRAVFCDNYRRKVAICCKKRSVVISEREFRHCCLPALNIS